MRAAATALGVVLLCAMVAAPLVVYAREHGWWEALTNAALLSALIAVPVGAVSLLTYGMTGEWWQ